MPDLKAPRDFRAFHERCVMLGTLAAFNRICARHHASLEDAYGPRRTKSLRDARAECFAWMHERGFSHPEIGDLWGRDPTSALSSVRRFKARGLAVEEKPGRRVTDLDRDLRLLEARVAALEDQLARALKTLAP